MWKEVESRKADKARMEETGRTGREERRKPTIEKEKTIARIMEEKKEEEDLIELRTMDEMAP